MKGCDITSMEGAKMTATKKIICVWPDGDGWTVSRDTVSVEYGERGNTGAIHTATEDVCDTREDAIKQALKIADSLPVYEQDERGLPSLVEGDVKPTPTY